MRIRLALLAVSVSVSVSGCGAGEEARAPDPTGSTLKTTWQDKDGNGILEPAPAERFTERTELAPPSRPNGELARLGIVSDVHLVDEESPAHLPFLDRFGDPFSSTFRPHEALQPHVLAAAVRSLNAARPDAVLETGDLGDSAQANELDVATRVLNGGRAIDVDSGARGYEGPQRANNPDPLFYRPDVDAPRRPGLLRAASRPLRSPGLEMPWRPVAGNHDLLVQGEIAPTPRTNELATGDRALTRVDEGFDLPREESALAPETVDRVLSPGLPGPTQRRSPDAGRRQLEAGEVIARLRRASEMRPSRSERLDYAFDAGAGLRVIVLDLTARDRGSGGTVTPATLDRVRAELRRAGDRRIAVATHQPLRSTAGGERVLALLDRDPRVVAALSGHTHRNRIMPRRTRDGGYWLVETASLVDHPQQARMLALVRTEGGGLALSTWMLDHAPGDDLAATARRLAYLDVQGGRPDGAAGGPGDRNALLFLPRR